MNIGCPAGLDVGRSGVESIIPLVVEGDGLEGIFSLLDIRARPNFIILKEDRAICLSLGIYTNKSNTSTLQK